MRVSVQPVFVSAISNHARCEVRSHAGHWHKAEWPTVSARSVAITLSFVVTFFPFLSCSLVRGNRYMVHPLLPGYYQRFSCWRLTHDRRATNAAPSRIGTRSHAAIPMKAISSISTRSTSRSGMVSFSALPFVGWYVCEYQFNPFLVADSVSVGCADSWYKHQGNIPCGRVGNYVWTFQAK